jgi:hypothetical protein
MPKGSDAPGKVFPPPMVPMKGSIASYAELELVCGNAIAGSSIEEQQIADIILERKKYFRMRNGLPPRHFRLPIEPVDSKAEMRSSVFHQ